MQSLDDCDEVFRTMLENEASENVEAKLDAILKDYPVLSFELGRGSVFWRGRKCGEEGFLQELEMSYPPAGNASLGRLNDQGMPCLYAATRRSTVFAELGVGVGDYVQLAGFRVLADKTIRAIAVGEYFHVYKTGYLRILGRDPDKATSRLLNSLDPEHGKRIVYIDAFLGNLLADKDAKTKNYVASRLFAGKAFKKSGADAMFYPSVQDTIGMNLAVLPNAFDERMHGACAQLVQITKIRSFGFYEHRVCKQATGVDDDGCYIWQSLESDLTLPVFRMTKEEHEQALKAGASFLDLPSTRMPA